MPATHLMSVDLPAPLSPTSAITSPSRTSKSAPCRAWTEPKLFDTPRNSRVGELASLTARLLPWWRRPGRAPPPNGGLLAVLRVGPDADLAPLQEALLEQQLVVRLRDPDRGQRSEE